MSFAKSAHTRTKIRSALHIDVDTKAKKRDLSELDEETDFPSEIIILGNYKLLLPDDEKIFAYKRCYNGQTMLVICNFSKDSLNFPFEEIRDENCIISNYEENEATKLRPYETRVYLY